MIPPVAPAFFTRMPAAPSPLAHSGIATFPFLSRRPDIPAAAAPDARLP